MSCNMYSSAWWKLQTENQLLQPPHCPSPPQCRGSRRKKLSAYPEYQGTISKKSGFICFFLNFSYSLTDTGWARAHLFIVRHQWSIEEEMEGKMRERCKCKYQAWALSKLTAQQKKDWFNMINHLKVLQLLSLDNYINFSLLLHHQ